MGGTKPETIKPSGLSGPQKGSDTDYLYGLSVEWDRGSCLNSAIYGGLSNGLDKMSSLAALLPQTSNLKRVI